MSINPKTILVKWEDLEMDLNSSFNERLNRSPEQAHLEQIFINGKNNILNYVNGDSNSAKTSEIAAIVEQSENQESTQDLHCSCQTVYDDSKFYIQCDKCNIWYHGDCEKVTSEQAEHIDIYACKKCRSK